MMTTQIQHEPRRLRVLVTWGTKLGGTEGIARMIGDVLQREGVDVAVQRAADVRDVNAYDAAVIGGALYANRWHREARRFVERNVVRLRRIPVWLFSSGPLDDSADREDIPPVALVSVLMDRIGACGHATFGGCLPEDAKGIAAAAMAKTRSGDWRNSDRICAWAAELAHLLPAARPRTAIEPWARSIRRLVAHAAVGWTLCIGATGILLNTVPLDAALAHHTGVAALLFGGLAIHYFRARGARAPLPTALAWTGIVAALDAVIVAGIVLRDFSMFTSFVGLWLPLALIFLTTWGVGTLLLSMPWPKATRPRSQDRGAPARAPSGSQSVKRDGQPD